MKPILEDRDPVDNSRRSFLATVAGLGAAGMATFGQTTAAIAANPGSPAEFTSAFRSIILHENEHVVFLAEALGSAARPKPTFKGLQQPDLQSFLNLARAFENTGAGAYLNATEFIHSSEYLEAAASIALVEARHAGFINVALGQPITVNNTSFESFNSPGYVACSAAPIYPKLERGTTPDLRILLNTDERSRNSEFCSGARVPRG